MKKKSKISQEDLNAFQEAVKGIKPLSQRKVRLSSPKPSVERKKTPQEEDPSFFDGSEPHEIVQGDDSIEFKRDGVADKILRKLGKGQYNVEAVLDLHKMTVEQARTAVNSFLHQCLGRKIRTALIVHGKGMPGNPPILKNQLNCWLRQAKVVLAFRSASPRHGGKGAVYILLKRSEQEKFFE